MRRLLVVTLCLLVALPLAAVEKEKKKKVAVIDLIDESATLEPALIERATSYLWDRVVAAGSFVVIARDRQKEAALTLRRESHQECYDRSCNIQLAQRLAADTMLETRVTYFGDQYQLAMSLTDLAKVAADRGATVPFDGTEVGLKGAIDRLVPQITGSAFAEQGVGAQSDWRAAGQQLVIVEFMSTTPGAAVSVDGKMLCTALPCRKNLTRGAHALLYQAPNYLDHAEEVTVEAAITVTRDLKPDFAILTVLTTPDGLAVEVDRKPMGDAPVTLRVPPGLHRVTVSSPCHLEKGLEFALQRGEERTLELTPEPRKAGLSVISEDDSGNAVAAPVLVDGVEVGRAPGSFTVPLCSKKLAVIITDDDKYEADLTLKENETLEVRATLKGELDAVAAEGHAKASAFAADKPMPEKSRPYLYKGAGVLGIGVVMAALGTGFTVAAGDKFDEYRSLTAAATVAKEMTRPGFSAALYQKKVDGVYAQGERFEASGIAMLSVGGAAIVTGVVLMLITEEVPVSAAVTPQGVFVGWRGEW